MPSENEYYKLITRNTPLTKEELEKVKEFESLAREGNFYKEFGNDDLNHILDNYEAKLTYLETMPLEKQNSNIRTAINTHQNIHKEISSKQALEQQRIDKSYALQRKLENGIQRRAGFTNASIIIFFVMLIGFILSVTLLSLT